MKKFSEYLEIASAGKSKTKDPRHGGYGGDYQLAIQNIIKKHLKKDISYSDAHKVLEKFTGTAEEEGIKGGITKAKVADVVRVYKSLK